MQKSDLNCNNATDCQRGRARRASCLRLHNSYQLPPASAGGEALSEAASAEIEKDAPIHKALAKALRNY